MFYSIRLQLLQFCLIVLLLSTLCFSACPTGDLTGDCAVTLDDLAAFADQWLDGGGSANLDGVGAITLGDFALLARDWRNSGLTLVINEFMADNSGFVVDNAGDSDDWVEIHNYGSEPIDIGGMYLTDNLDTPNQWQAPANVPQITTIPAGGYLLIWADNEATEGPLHAWFRLAAGGGEDVGLFDGNGQRIDAVADFAAQDQNHSYGRYPDAGSEWRMFGESTQTVATPGRSNRQTSGEANVMINEIMYHPYNAGHPLSEDIREEYIELFNAGDFPVEVSGWRITGGVEFEFPAGAAVGEHGYLVIAADTATFEAIYGGAGSVVGGWTGRLSNKGDRLLLLSAEGQVIDEVNYSDEGDWGLRRLGPVDAYGHRGWIWSDEHDGLGKSLEVISMAMPNEYGQNWAASLTDKGTPGTANTATGVKTETRLLVNTGAMWKYEDNGRTDIGDPADGVAWFGHMDYDDSGWSQGPSQLGYGDQDENWPVGYGGNATAKHITTYFRHTFTVTDVYLSLKLRLLRDDGAVVYFNGEKVVQSNMDYATFNHLTLASAAVTGVEEDTFVDFPVGIDKLRQGRNVLAVEIHQQTPDSADISFDLILEATVRPDQTPAANDIAPMILDVTHRPLIPHANEMVTVTARLADTTAAGLTATLCHRVDRSTYSKYVYPTYNPADFTRVQMYDDGLHGDGAPGDGVYGGVIPARQNRAVVEFFVEARDAAGNVRTWPAASTIDGKLEQVTNGLYQVDDLFDPAGGGAPGSHGTYRVIMTEGERARLAAIGTTSDRNSNAEMNATFISADGTDIKMRYNAGVRNRGHGSRSNRPNNMRITLAHDRPWKDVTAMNINARYPWVQNAGSAVFQQAGLATADARPVRVLINGTDLSLIAGSSPMYGTYVHLESIDTDFTDAHFGLDAQGNVYKCLRDAGPADFRYFGNDPTTYRLSYFKETNERQDDWTDLFELTRVLSTAPDATYVEDVKRVLDPEQWLRFIALHVLLANNETTLATGYGDDYFMYCGVVDPRFILIAYDLDTIFGKGAGPGGAAMLIWRATGIPALNRFMRHPAFLPRYYYHLNDLIETVLSPEQLDRILNESLGRYVAPLQIQQMKDFVAQRNTYVLGLIERDFTINVPLSTVNGYYQTGVNTVTLTGTADAIATRTVRVGGELAAWSPVDGRWTSAGGGASLLPGINRVVVRTYADPDGAELLEEGFVDVWCDDASQSTLAGGALAQDTTLNAAAGPWRVTGEVIVGPGVTLTIEPGTTLFFEEAGGITVTGDAAGTGRLSAEGTPYRRIRLSRIPGGANWRGLRFENPSHLAAPAENRLTCVDMEYGDGQGQAINVSYAKVHIDHVSWAGGNSTALELEYPYLRVSRSTFPSISGTESVHGHGMTTGGYAILEGNTFGATTGYNDIIDFSACKRPGPIPEFHDNIFLGGGDDGIDLDGADAHIEGNVFSHFHKDFSGSSTCNAIATGASGGVSEIMVARNVFHDNDHDVLLKEGCYMWAEQNVFAGGSVASISFGEYDRGVSAGKGAYLDGNVFWNNAAVFESYFDPDPIYGPQELTIHRSIIPDAFGGLGVGNLDADPQFVDADDFHVKRSSPAVGRGANGLDMGAHVPAGASISGGPYGATHRTTAGFAIGGPGIFGYRYRLMDNGTWAGGWSGVFEIAAQPQIALTGLANGHTYTLHVIGRNSAGRWQSEDAAATWTWTVDTSSRRLVIQEVLAINRSALEHDGARPDAVELFYDGPGPIDLAGMSLTDDPDEPAKHVFAAGTIMNPGTLKVLYCDPTAVGPEYVGFVLDGDGDGVCLFDTPARGRLLVDSVEFGPQAPDLSVGRLADGTWHLTVPTFGQDNVAAPMGDPNGLKINEWYAAGDGDDFVELFNPRQYPVDLSGLYLTDNPVHAPDKATLGPLSFVEASGFVVFHADGRQEPGHVTFSLASDVGVLSLLGEDLRRIDTVLYYWQTANVSEGLSPDGGQTRQFFATPTPGHVNRQTVAINEVLSHAHALDPDWIELYNTADEPIDIGGWFLSDSESDLRKYEIPAGTVLDTDTYVVFNEAQHFGNAAAPGCHTPFALSENGDAVYLSSGRNGRLTEYRIEEVFGAAESNVAFGRHLKSDATYNFVAMSANTPGTANVAPKVGPVVISEIMYHPAGNPDAEYVELLNISAQPVTLFDPPADQAWTFEDEDGIAFVFPSTPVTLAAGERALLVKDAGAFSSLFSAPGGTRIFEWGTSAGSLSNAGEKLQLNKPGDADTPVGERNSIRVDRVNYSDGSHPLGQDPWPAAADGTGRSLHRVAPSAYGNDVVNWQPADPSPGL